jgi:hypothetical protein
MRIIYPISKNYEGFSKQAQVLPTGGDPVSSAERPQDAGQSAYHIISDEMHQLNKALGWAQTAAQGDPKNSGYAQGVKDLQQAIQLLNKAMAELGNHSPTAGTF